MVERDKEPPLLSIADCLRDGFIDFRKWLDDEDTPLYGPRVSFMVPNPTRAQIPPWLLYAGSNVGNHATEIFREQSKDVIVRAVTSLREEVSAAARRVDRQEEQLYAKLYSKVVEEQLTATDITDREVTNYATRVALILRVPLVRPSRAGFMFSDLTGSSLGPAGEPDYDPGIQLPGVDALELAAATALIYEFSERYTRAKDESADAHAERIMEIAEQAMSADVNPNAARVAIDAYKWVASKLKPKRYGERIRADLAGDITVIVDHVKDPS